ncbi:MAG: type IV secretion system DNA-binding domain-containing protein, partial [Verrucomicrobiae bacterium]|nr:type IV secretion system DNA-binding domain-containing protein [Verrucomicrobiae bacterium]
MIFLLGGTPSKGGDGWDKDRMMIDRDSQTSVLHDRETIYSASFDKVSRLCFSTTIRIAVFGANLPQARTRLRNVVGAFQQFTLPQMNRLVLTCVKAGHGRAFRRLLGRKGFRPFSLSQEEIATLYHLPTKDISIPGIEWVESRHLEPPSGLPTASESGVTVLGNILHRGMGPEYGLRIDDRRRHVYLIGKTGMGKSTLLENMITSDIRNGKGVAVIDPHGDLADAILRLIPRNRTNDVVIFDPSDEAFPVAFNPLDTRNGAPITLLCSGIVGAFKKLHRDSWGPRLEHFLRNTILALLEAENTSMLGIPRMLTDQLYRQRVLRQVHDPVVRSFWDTEFAALAPQKLAEVVGPIQNKVGQFLSSPIIRNIVGQSRSTLDLRFIMDTGKILIVNLSKGKIGEDNSAMLGAMLVTRFQTDAMGRANILEAQRRDFCLYVDEFQNFATESFATILSEARKYRLSLTMANQYLAQMNEDVTAAVFGNVGTLVAFQVGIQDARLLAEQFDESRITPTDLASLPKYDVYNRVMVNGVTTPVFSGRTLPPPMLSPTHR